MLRFFRTLNMIYKFNEFNLFWLDLCLNKFKPN